MSGANGKGDVSGSAGCRAGGSAGGHALVEEILRDLSEAAARWEALVAQAETVTYSVDMGDLVAVTNADGKLVELTLHPTAMREYSHAELTDRLNLAFTALREEAENDYAARYGGAPQ